MNNTKLFYYNGRSISVTIVAPAEDDTHTCSACGRTHRKLYGYDGKVFGKNCLFGYLTFKNDYSWLRTIEAMKESYKNYPLEWSKYAKMFFVMPKEIAQ